MKKTKGYLGGTFYNSLFIPFEYTEGKPPRQIRSSELTSSPPLHNAPMVRSSLRCRGLHHVKGKEAPIVSSKAGKLAQSDGSRANATRKRAPTTSSDRQFGLGRGAHPLGIQPMGNLLLATLNDSYGRKKTKSSATVADRDVDGENGKPQRQVNARDVGLGALQVLSDSLVLDIAGRLPAQDLCRLGVCSRAFHVVCHQEELWRALTLEEFGGDFDFEHSWRWTYVKGALKARGGARSAGAEIDAGLNESSTAGEQKRTGGEVSMDYTPPLKVLLPAHNVAKFRCFSPWVLR